MSDRPRRTPKRERSPSPPPKEKSVNYKAKWALFNKGNVHAFRSKVASLARPALGDVETTINRSLSGSENSQNNAAVTLVYDPAPEPDLDPDKGDIADQESDAYKYFILQKYYNILFPGYNINEDRRYFRTYAKKYNAFFKQMHPEELVFYFYADFDPMVSGSEPMFQDTLGNKGTYANLPRYSNGCARLAPSPDTEPYYNVSIKEDVLTDGCHYHIVSVNYEGKNYKVKMGGLNKHTNRPYFYIQYLVGNVLQNFYGDFFPVPPSESGFGKKVITRLRRAVGGSTRKSPEESATLFTVGTTRVGNDGNKWTIKKASNGVQRWVRSTSFGKKLMDGELKYLRSLIK